jgi:DNA-binding IclR family transcriptional regulator
MTTVLRLATELRTLGALDLDENGVYRLGGWLWELGTLATNRSPLREVALPYMQDLYEATHENVQVAVLDGFDALFLDRIRGRHHRRLAGARDNDCRQKRFFVFSRLR